MNFYLLVLAILKLMVQEFSSLELEHQKQTFIPVLVFTQQERDSFKLEVFQLAFLTIFQLVSLAVSQALPQ